jgi:hypothetical protein
MNTVETAFIKERRRLRKKKERVLNTIIFILGLVGTVVFIQVLNEMHYYLNG